MASLANFFTEAKGIIKDRKVLIIGPGYLGKLLAIRLLEDGNEVHTLSRNDPEIEGGVHFSCDIRHPFSLNHDYDLVYYLVSAANYSEKAYQDAYHYGLEHSLNAISNTQRKPFFVFASSTSVFAENSGAWVTEDSQTSTGSMPKALLEGEKLLLESEFKASVLRFAGIYGPGRDRLAVQVASGKAKLRKQASISNRIHQYDAVGVLRFVANISEPKPKYLVCDSTPTQYNDILIWLNERLIAMNQLDYDSQQSSGRRMSNKYCSNELIVKEGYRFLFPSFKEGFLQIINDSEHLRGLYEPK